MLVGRPKRLRPCTRCHRPYDTSQNDTLRVEDLRPSYGVDKTHHICPFCTPDVRVLLESPPPGGPDTITYYDNEQDYQANRYNPIKGGWRSGDPIK